MNITRFRSALFLVLAAFFLVSLGAAGGYWFAQDRAGLLNQQQLDLVRVAQTVDLHNRLIALRMLRENKAKDDEIASLELGAISLLMAIQPSLSPVQSPSRHVLEKVAKVMTQYVSDFPGSQLDPEKFEVLHELVAFGK